MTQTDSKMKTKLFRLVLISSVRMVWDCTLYFVPLLWFKD